MGEKRNRLYVGLSKGIAFLDLEVFQRKDVVAEDLLNEESSLLVKDSETIAHMQLDGNRLVYGTMNRLVSISLADSAGYLSKKVLLDNMRPTVGTAITSDGTIYFVEFEKPNTNLCRVRGTGPYERELVRRVPFEAQEMPGGFALVKDGLFAIGAWKLPAPSYEASVMVVPIDESGKCWRAVDQALATNMVLALDARGCLFCAGRFGKFAKPALEAFPLFASLVASGEQLRERVVLDDPVGASNVSAMSVSKSGDVFYVTTAGNIRLRRIWWTLD